MRIKKATGYVKGKGAEGMYGIPKACNLQNLANDHKIYDLRLAELTVWDDFCSFF